MDTLDTVTLVVPIPELEDVVLREAVVVGELRVPGLEEVDLPDVIILVIPVPEELGEEKLEVPEVEGPVDAELENVVTLVGVDSEPEDEELSEVKSLGAELDEIVVVGPLVVVLRLLVAEGVRLVDADPEEVDGVETDKDKADDVEIDKVGLVVSEVETGGVENDEVDTVEVEIEDVGLVEVDTDEIELEVVETVVAAIEDKVGPEDVETDELGLKAEPEEVEFNENVIV